MRVATVASIVSLSLLSAAIADDARAAIRKPINIPAQELGSALEKLSEEREIQLLYRADIIGNRRTEGAVGQLTPEEALKTLLSGTGLTYHYLNESTMTIVPIPSGREPVEEQRPAPAVEDRKRDDKPLRKSFWDRFRMAQVDSGSTVGPQSTLVPDSQESASTSRVEEIVVTAQKRAESLKDVPISISVLNGANLDQTTGQGVTEALRGVPGVSTYVNSQGGNTELSIRGVSTQGTFSGASTVAYYIDSVPFGLVKQPIAPDPDIYDLQRVEVLRGPQGTLYGANALNGVVRVLTNDANLQDVQFKARATVSNTEEGSWNNRVDAALNVPLVEGKLAARLVAGREDLSGWIGTLKRDDANDTLKKNMRLKINAEPTDQLSIGLFGWVSRTDLGAPSSGGDDFKKAVVLPEPIENNFDTYGMKVGYNFQSFSLTSVTSYLNYSSDGLLDLSLYVPNFFSQFRTIFHSNVVSEEINLSSTTAGSWRWSAGTIYRDASGGLHTGIVPTFGRDDIQTSKSYAVYGELTKLFLDGRLEFTGGLRYFHDDTTEQKRLPPLYDAKDTFSATTPRFVFNWRPNQDATIYASYSEGFRSGAEQNGEVAVLGFPSVKPDRLRNYEVGSKGTAVNGLLGYSAAVYYIDWRDIQQSILLPSVLYPGIQALALVNGTAASGVGAEFGLTSQPLSGLTLAVSFGWNDLTEDANVLDGSGNLIFAKGDRLLNSPKYTGSISAEYAFPMGDSLKGRISASINYTSPLYTPKTYEPTPGNVVRYQPIASNVITMGRLGLSVDAGPWTATLFADNVTNERDFTYWAVGVDPLGASERLRPRTEGLQIEYHY